ncbi:hypothetical protein VitviT2T_019989 [Vitis vinifera]|uniref:Disease resistance protein winged helix domain-containing protein n=1 Tax=Vitis vinifera TaxID=29760 RepID=A0ABY9D2Z0_VITVI|nr:hypothetical protein VitviT2T_019989 [Vitis vinifera]
MRGHKNLHELKQLPYDDCLKIFQTQAFEHMNIDEHPNLESIDRRIVDKCGGSPLAARALGGLLHSELWGCECERELYSKVWDFTNKECDIIPALRLSYNHLSSHLKRCFTYCAIFPQDYEFTKQGLIFMWMAEGLIQQSKDNRKIEDLGDKYFDELLSRLTSLENLSIEGMFPYATSFSDDPHLIILPTTLTSLHISQIHNLESLASLSLQTLTSLRSLVIFNCPKLQWILPREGLVPDSLLELRIWRCPHLKQRYLEEEGHDWPKIADIPRVEIHD